MSSDTTSRRERAQLQVERAAHWRDRAAADYAAAHRSGARNESALLARAYERSEVAFEYLALAIAELSSEPVAE